MSYPWPEYAWAPAEVTNPNTWASEQTTQAERDHQAQQLGLPVGLNEPDYMAAFQQLMASPEWAATQQARQAAIDAETATTWDNYQEARGDRFQNWLGTAALIGGAGVLAGALGPGVSAASGSGALTGVTLPSTVAPTGAVVGALGPSIPAGAGAAAIGPALAAGSGGAAAGAAGAAAGGVIANNLPAILSGASTLIGGVMADNSADDAVDAITQSNSEALDYQRESRDIALGLLEPERQSANAAIARMLQMQGLPIPASLQADLDASGVTLDEFDVTDTPGYQFRLDESMRALEAGAFARGGGMSGGFARSALRYAQDYASSEYDKIYQQLGTLAGRSTSSGAATVALNYGGNAARISQDTGEARASGYVAQGNAWQNALDQVAQLPWEQWFPGRQRQAAVGV
jgi:hypothetical protein